MPPTFYNLLSLFLRVDGVNLGVRIDGVYGCASAPNSPMYQGAGLSFSGPPRYTKKSRPELAYIDLEKLTFFTGTGRHRVQIAHFFRGRSAPGGLSG